MICKGESMTEKRYKAIPETAEYKDTVTGEFLSPKFEEDFYKVLDLLNENEELKQFKEEVFNKIDMHLRMLPIARDREYNDEYGDPSLYTGAIYMLETLKKELEE